MQQSYLIGLTKSYSISVTGVFFVFNEIYTEIYIVEYARARARMYVYVRACVRYSNIYFFKF